jgi:hypothetical protein
VENEYWRKEFRDKYGNFDCYRIYKPSQAEFDELVTVVKRAIADHRAAENERKQGKVRLKC